MIRDASSRVAVTRQRLLIDVVGFQLVWLACALGAARGTSLPGIAASVAFIALHLVGSERTTSMLRMIVAAGLSGLLAESLLVATGLVRHAAPWPSELIAPAWIVALWMAFGATVGTLRRMLGRRPLPAAAALAALLGPVSYIAGAGFGALTLAEPTSASLIGIAVIWAAALPFLFVVWGHVYRRIRRPTDPSG